MNDIAERLNGENDRITVDTINEPNSNDMPDFKWIDGMHILQTILSRQLPPECYGGIINLILATQLANATTEEIEDSLVSTMEYLNKLKFLGWCIYHHFVFFRDICMVLDHMSPSPTFLRCVSLRIKHI